MPARGCAEKLTELVLGRAGLQPEDGFAVDSQGFAGGNEERYVWCGLQHAPARFGQFVQHVLAVVEQDQGVTVGQGEVERFR